ncbi:hypothetical protein IMZ38_02960 [Thermosphaera chiliense]|uniref:Uncharacterized protein n=1 Tax=Thermosphaera chiliense TaxID=3402707 RepID=A0A7M1URJ4_9CREN|nr:hypothetical protein [Thermosphaera aggregans]QOR94888.1 hypothetical protein IMZ38_02960 [Thermosphaera aggregans]
MIDNNHAVVEDYPNDFDPSQWNLYIEYPIQNEKLPTITRIPLHSGAIANSTSWGVRVAVTPDGNYIGVAFSDYGGDYTLHVRILDREGNIVNSYDYGPDKGSDWYANVWRGMLDIAANETGFMVAWTNLTRSGNSRVVLYSFVPVTGTPTQPQHIYLDTYQNHPLVAFFEHSNGTRWWIIGYGKQTTSVSRYTLNLLDLTPQYTNRFANVNLAGAPAADVKIGVDVMGGLIFDNVTKSFLVVARNKTTDHNIIGIHGNSHSTLGFFIFTYTIDSRTGDQGPEPDMTGSYSYYNVYPMYTALLGSGRYLLTAYNENSSALAYAVFDLDTKIVSRISLYDYGSATTYYPWIAGGSGKWLLAYSARGYVNITLVSPDGSNTGLVSLADRSSSYVRVAYDAGAGLFPVAYSVRDLGTSNYDLFLALVGEDGGIGSFVIPVSTDDSVSNIPVNMVVLPGGSPGTVVVFAVEGNDLVAYYVSSNYPETLQPMPIPEPVIVSLAVAGTGGALVTYIRRRLKRSKLSFTNLF